MIENYKFIVNTSSSLRLDHFLADKIPNISRAKIQLYIKAGQVKVNGVAGKSSLVLKGAETIECNFISLSDKNKIESELIDLEYIYEDESLIVINKPSGLVVHPGNGNKNGTLLNGLMYHFKKLSYSDSDRPGIVHRLDKDTSGVIIVAKDEATHDLLSSQFKKREVKKEYIAFVWGKINKNGMINSNIGRHFKNRIKYDVLVNGGKQSITKYKLIEYFPPFSVVKLFPLTGRTHQLRVHMKSIGHPIFCDNLYGGGMRNSRSFHVKYSHLINSLYKIIKRLALHACSIEIYHPKNHRIAGYEAPIPNDMDLALSFLKNEYK